MAIVDMFSASHWKNSWTASQTSLRNYYHPLLRAGSAKPLWHMMIATSVVMYTTKYVFFGHRAVTAKRVEEKKAIAEYRAIHGGGGHH
mmetsp:Transcript_48353/g.71660  ORF Transcript_48353/g.71660 Transcript_48353/m.71660 type:complete len:88 (+) Transcript_48353:83-346(+)|eukprot:CAMPEP_0195518040 /NCGR_PEP_ID=MMETSP0794_2-20130614/12018_1 /TAXON_ID=515487 /ORGANISM="Stephanopyxis turris, Strain CCMP 815" /LENGTH=87 /DNA_ID=CAMNT_0040646939 /DNA_START=83 /DNA_END=346 /DNA_ORIENTATION=+